MQTEGWVRSRIYRFIRLRTWCSELRYPKVFGFRAQLQTWVQMEDDVHLYYNIYW